jgi:hemolysin D
MTAIPLKLQALRDLLKRYGAVFAAAWAIREQLQNRPRQDHELAFLPASLELAETPVHPAPRWAMRTIGTLAVIVVLVSVIGQLDIVVSAKGKLVPNARVKVIQPAITGVVRRILVEDGQRVEAGALLMELDPTQAEADSGKAHAAKMAAALAMARSQALLAAQKSNQPPLLAPVAEATTDDMRDAQRFADGTFREYEDKLAKSQAELVQREAELDGTLHDIDRLKATSPLARQQANDYRSLVEEKYVAKSDYLDKEQNAIQQEHDLASKTSHAAELRAAIVGQKADIASILSQFRREQLDALDKASQQFDQSRDDETKATTRQHLMSLNAPVEGTVQQLAVHTVGGVVTTAQSLMEIVPEDALEVEVNVENKDIGFVKADQEAIVKIDAFPYTRYGYLQGTVRSVSNDAVQDKKQGLSFVAHVRLPSGRMRIDDQWINLTPGMAVSAEIKTGLRSVAGYFLDPLVQTAQESLRER